MFTTKSFWNVIGNQCAYDGHMFLRKFHKAFVKSFNLKKDLTRKGRRQSKGTCQTCVTRKEKEEHIGCANGTRLVLAHPRRPGL